VNGEVSAGRRIFSLFMDEIYGDTPDARETADA
jgi:hypothetical protein